MIQSDFYFETNASVFVVMYICCVGAMKIKESAEQIALDLFQNCDVPEELSEAFDVEVVLNDDAVGRSRHERTRGLSCNLKTIIILCLCHSKLILKPIKVRPDGPHLLFSPKMASVC